MKLYVYHEYNDESAYGEQIIKLFENRQDALNHLRNRVETCLDIKLEDLNKIASDSDTVEQDYVSFDTSHGVNFFIVEEMASIPKTPEVGDTVTILEGPENIRGKHYIVKSGPTDIAGIEVFELEDIGLWPKLNMRVVSEKKPDHRTFTETITISRKEADRIEKYLNVEPQDEDECFGEDEIIDHEVTFEDGTRMAVQCCGVQYDEHASNLAWTQAVLFDKNGHELTCSEVGEDYTGEWKLDYDNNEYIVNVIVEPR